jgi:glycosyltransferase involved in cell wall biosynthesis
LDQEDGHWVYASNLLRQLVAKDATSRYLILLRTAKHAHLFDDLPNAVTEVISARVKLWWDQVELAMAARRARADIIFSPKFSMPLLSTKPSVFVLHGSDWYVNPSNYKWWDNLYIRLVMPLYCAAATRLVSISQCTTDDLVKYAHLDASKVTVTYAAPSPHFTAATDKSSLSEFAGRYKLPPRFILSVARAYHTGHGRLPEYPGGNNERLVKGYQQYRAQGGSLPLVIVGKNIKEYLQAREFGENELQGIHFTGFIPHDEIVKVYNLAEFFVLVTLYESFGFPLVEAMASGCPVIVSATGACPEVAGGAARLVDPYSSMAIAEAMSELDSSPAKRKSLREAGLEVVRKFTWELTAERTLSVFDSIVPRATKNSELTPKSLQPKVQ